MNTVDQKLAILGGAKINNDVHEELFHWPIVTKEDEDAVIEVLRRGAMSANDITKKFEDEFSHWIGRKYALGYPSGTESLRAAYWAIGIGSQDEVICPSTTFWATATPVLSLGATVNFADICDDTLCIDPDDIEHRIGPKTKAIVVTHYRGYPCDMDRIMAIAQKHNLIVIEDVSHAQGGYYKGKKVGTIGDIAAMSMMSGKTLACGEAGVLTTDNRAYYERCIAFGFYERTTASNFCETDDSFYYQAEPELREFVGLPMGGYKHRANQTAMAMARVQLKHYDERIQEIDRVMKRFWNCLEGVPGIKPHMVTSPGSTMAGWFSPRGLYNSEELGGLSCAKFCEAVRAEGVEYAMAGANIPLHLHPVFHAADLFNHGKPTVVAFGQRDVRQGPGSLPVAEKIKEICFGVPPFKHDQPEIIERYAAAYRKVAENAKDLL